MEVERTNVEPMPVRSKAPPSPEKSKIVETFSSLFPTFNALAAVLAVRLFLLFSVIGAFILAQTALESDGYHSIWVLTVYCSFTVIPLVWLDVQGKRR